MTRTGPAAWAAALVSVALSLGSAWGAAPDDELYFDIPAQRADVALTAFAQQASVSVLFPFDAVSRLRTNRVVGTYTVSEALEILLEGTGLSAVLQDGRLTVRVQDEAEEPPASADARDGERRKGFFANLLERLGERGAHGPEREDASAPGPEMEEVVVTGTRIQRETGFTTPTPVTTITPVELAAYAPGGTLAEALNKLPQFFGTETAQRGGHPQYSGGRSTLDMRGMGAQRTLVLIDGARTVPVDSSSRVNIDFIPSGLIERVDVVTGGASAAYGADALAGVTNFILDRDFEGFRADVEA
ncbi:MAG TPA: TonB-dependent receptor, partial [Gammaproteobacteria bacterium]